MEDNLCQSICFVYDDIESSN